MTLKTFERMDSKRAIRKTRIGKSFLHLFLSIAGFVMVFPFIWMMLGSFKTLKQLLVAPLSFWPHPWILSNYPDSWNALPFGRAYFNSIYICLLVVGGSLITCSMAAYGFSRFNIRGQKPLFILFLSTQMVPKQVLLIPFYFLMSKFGWVDSHLSLIIPAIMTNPFAVFLLRQFILSLPPELEEAALIDGASRWRIFRSVVLPNIRPGLGAVSIIIALDTWNSFLFPLILLNDQNKFTVPLLLATFKGQFGQENFALVMAASAISTIPMLIAFVIGQRKIVASLASSGLAGR